jgi:hypothetical protein
VNRPANAPFNADFKLSITKALADQLDEKLDKLTPHTLTKEAIDSLERRPGVYLLWYREQRVYVGKAQQPLPVRLSNHLTKLSGRRNLSIDEVKFVCLYVDEDLDAAAPEKLLIKKYRARTDGGDLEPSRGVPWNTNGFGNKDPGKERDGSAVASNHFDALYPIRLDFDALALGRGPARVGDVLSSLKSQLPYNFRFDKKSEWARRDYKRMVDVPATTSTTERAIALIVQALPEGWQATALPGYLILYPEKEIRQYPSALRLWRRSGDMVEGTNQQARFAPDAEIRESEDDANANDEDGA